MTLTKRIIPCIDVDLDDDEDVAAFASLSIVCL